jgi:hypothetical protein
MVGQYIPAIDAGAGGEALADGKIKYAIISILAILLTAYVGLFSHTLPRDLFLRPVDIFHISLMLSYTAIYYSISAYAKVAK